MATFEALPGSRCIIYVPFAILHRYKTVLVMIFATLAEELCHLKYINGDAVHNIAIQLNKIELSGEIKRPPSRSLGRQMPVLMRSKRSFCYGHQAYQTSPQR